MIDRKELNEHFEFVINKKISAEKIYNYLILLSKELNIDYDILFNEFVSIWNLKIEKICQNSSK